MRRIKQLFTYNPATGIEAYRTRDQRRETIVRDSGLSGEVLRIAELNKPGARYFTTTIRAIEAFIDKADAALADPSRKRHHADWRHALGIARRDLFAHVHAADCQK